MSVPKTKPTEVSAESHIAAIANEEQRNDAQTLVALMRRATKQEPSMWGPSIGGFASYHYKYASGREGDSALTGLSFGEVSYQLYWHVAKHPDPLSNPRCSTGIEIVLSLDRELPNGSPRAIHMGKCCSDGQVWSYEADRGWYLPSVEQVSIWNQDPDERCDPCRRPDCSEP